MTSTFKVHEKEFESKPIDEKDKLKRNEEEEEVDQMDVESYNKSPFFIFTIGRMNPPTPGHFRIIRALIDVGIEKGVDTVYIILSKTHKSGKKPEEIYKNPIPCIIKKQILCGTGTLPSMVNSLKQKMIDGTKKDEVYKEKIKGMMVKCVCTNSDEKGPMNTMLRLIRTIEPDNIIPILGEDRVEMLTTIQTMIKDKPVSRKYLKRGNNTTLSETKGINTNALSATFVRNLVKSSIMDEDEDGSKSISKFITVYRPYLSIDDIRNLYIHIWHGLDLDKYNTVDEATKLFNDNVEQETSFHVIDDDNFNENIELFDVPEKRKRDEDDDVDENPHPKKVTRATRGKKKPNPSGGKTRKRKNIKTLNKKTLNKKTKNIKTRKQ